MGHLLIVAKLKAKWKFHMAAMLFHIVQENYLIKHYYN